MTDTRSPRAVLSGTGRLLGVDAARAVALVGMMVTHLEPAFNADGTRAIPHLIASGRASALFAVLAGVGIALTSGGTEPPRGRAWVQASAATATRAVLLFGLGLLLCTLDSGVAVILSYYGLLFLVAIPFLGLRAPWLLAAGAAAIVVTPVLSQWFRWGDPGSLDSAQPTIETLGTDPSGALASLLLTGYYPVLTWSAYLMIGMGVGRLALDRAKVAALVTAAGVAVAVLARLGSSLWLEMGGLRTLQEATTGAHVVGGPIDADLLSVSFAGTTPTTSWAWLGIASPHSGAPPDLLATAGSALAVLGAMLLVAGLVGRMIWPIAAIGSMTLTLYSLHVTLRADWVPETEPDALLIHLCIAAAIAIPWRRYVGRGPLEALIALAVRRVRSSFRPRTS